MSSIAQVQTTDRNVNQLQQNITQAINPLLQNPITQGAILKSQVLKVGANTINHGLGYQMTGYTIISTSAASNFYDNVQSSTNLNQSFVLNSSVAVTINIYVF